ncbi:type II toxin-antitoxin system RelE/ParE family toxin [Abyssalbus ytuae]|uniref:Type II toxin-antitoxin system RelE/ParE family toxin n=1 Tax=Abyssalbus ytuae TaxID=2926907 RepID=A0A9E6ZN88_9FLAO|nr:type II toxin-antitoxin system RelE/ParE family toxin [Abyssalbus ytuae]UOB18992.1 type II toxin-antitoxin system RelE/ParE family toxin [Abyssalbus ytuae]
MATLKVIWSNRAKTQLKSIHDYIKNKLKSPQAARNVRQDILRTSKSIVFAKQYELDEIQPEYRRMLVRHYKILYKEKHRDIHILGVFDTQQSTERQANDDY